MIIDKIELRVIELLKSIDLSLYDMVIEDDIIVIYIDNDGHNVSLDDCIDSSKIIGDYLDDEGITTEYGYDVSSPGVCRTLRKYQHFQDAIGELVDVVLNNKDKITGTLSDVDDSVIVIDGDYILFDDIKNVNVAYIEKEKK